MKPHLERVKLSCFNTCNFFRQKRDENGNGNDDEDDDYDDDENFRHYDVLIVSILVTKIQWNRSISYLYPMNMYKLDKANLITIQCRI